MIKLYIHSSNVVMKFKLKFKEYHDMMIEDDTHKFIKYIAMHCILR